MVLSLLSARIAVVSNQAWGQKQFSVSATTDHWVLSGGWKPTEGTVEAQVTCHLPPYSCGQGPHLSSQPPLPDSCLAAELFLALSNSLGPSSK